MRLGYPTITWGGVVGHPAGVTSVKDLYYFTAGDTIQAIRDIGEVGYSGTEVFDGNLAQYMDRKEELLAALTEAGLELVSVYTGANFIYDDILDDELDKITRAASMAKTFGAQRLVLGGGAIRSGGPRPDDYAKVGRGLYLAAAIAADHGLDSSYHPHLGTISENTDGFHQIMDSCSIGFCPDTAHLVAGGIDPVDAITRYGDRLKHVHFKDYSHASGDFLPLGDGDINFEEIMRAIRDTGYDSWLMVELDYFSGHPQDAARKSKRYLDDLLGN